MTVPISSLFYDDAGPHVIPPGSGVAPRRATVAVGTARSPNLTPAGIQRMPVVRPVSGDAVASGSALRSLLETGIAGLAPLQSETLAPPAELPEEVVPIAELEYRGASALARARALRDAITRRDGLPTTDELDELFALLDLAASD